MTYLTLGIISRDQWMSDRIAASAAQEGVTDAGIDPDIWMGAWRRVLASAPGWAAAWESAVAAGIVEPGRDPAVITDGQIRAQVQSMKPFRLVGEAPAKQTEAAYLDNPQLLTTDWSEVLTLDMPGAGVWGISGIWTGNSTTTSAEFRANGGEGVRMEPKDGADRNLVSLTGVVDTPGPLVVEARKSVAAGVFMVRSLTMWWISAS